VSEFISIDHPLSIPVFVDDISGLKAPEKTITEAAIENVERELGIAACQIVLTVGSDQVNSMKRYLIDNRAVCVLRPGSVDSVDKLKKEDWFRDMVESGRYIITNRENSEVDISSTNIRKTLGSSSIKRCFNND
jgi:nicotinic acid mononucleotide adenylyltransferase